MWSKEIGTSHVFWDSLKSYKKCSANSGTIQSTADSETIQSTVFVLSTRLVGCIRFEQYNKALVLDCPLYKFNGLNAPWQYGKQAGQYKKLDVPDC